MSLLPCHVIKYILEKFYKYCLQTNIINAKKNIWEFELKLCF